MGLSITSLICLRLKSLPLLVVCLIVTGVQDFLLDYLLIRHFHYNPWWYAWIAIDMFVVGLLIAAYVMTPSRLLKRFKDAAGVFPALSTGLPLAFIAWLAYSGILCSKIALIFKRDIAQLLTEKDVYGPNFLRTAIGLTSVVFITLLGCHHSSKETDRIRSEINSLASTVTLDILDSVDFLDVLFIQETHVAVTFVLEDWIIAISCINLIRPFLSLLLLGLSSTNRKKLTTDVKIASVLICILLVNVPFLVVRMYLWHNLDHDISVFLIKNFIMVFLAFNELVDLCRQEGRDSDESDGQKFHPESVALTRIHCEDDGGNGTKCSPTQGPTGVCTPMAGIETESGSRRLGDTKSDRSEFTIA